MSPRRVTSGHRICVTAIESRVSACEFRQECSDSVALLKNLHPHLGPDPLPRRPAPPARSSFESSSKTPGRHPCRTPCGGTHKSLRAPAHRPPGSARRAASNTGRSHRKLPYCGLPSFRQRATSGPTSTGSPSTARTYRRGAKPSRCRNRAADGHARASAPPAAADGPPAAPPRAISEFQRTFIGRGKSWIAACCSAA